MSPLLPLLLVTLGWAPVMPGSGLVCESAGEGRSATADGIDVRRGLQADVRVVEALRDYDAGRISRAREKLLAVRVEASPQDAPALDFLVARCDLWLGWTLEAEVGFEGAVAAVPGLRDAALLERILFARANDDEPEAERLTAEVSPWAARFPELVFTVVQRALDEERPDDALTALARLDGRVHWRWNVSRLAKWRADALLLRDHDRAAWLQRLAELWRRWPTTAAAGEAEAALLEGLRDKASPPPVTLDELVDTAVERARTGSGALGRTLARAARARYGAEATGLSTLLVLWRHPVAWGRRTLREADEAIAVARHPAVRDHLALRKARALRKIGRSAEAMDAYRVVGRTAGGAHRAAHALLQGGELATRLGRFEDALWFYSRFVERHGGPEDGIADRPHALWSLAWSAYRLGRWAEADRALARIESDHPDAQDNSRRSYVERATYWRARIARHQGEDGRAHAGWAEVMSRYPHSYYATMARRRLIEGGVDVAPVPGGGGRSLRAPRPWEVRPVEAASASAVALYEAGLVDDARASLRRQYDLGRLGPRGIELVSAIYRSKPDWWRSHWIMQHGDALEAAPDGPERSRWLAAYPTPYSGAVLGSAKRHRVDPLLVWAVMRQESAFRVRARSHANALGLMQVLLPTAELVARKYLHEREPTLEHVLSRRGNVHYGTAYLRHLLNYFDGEVAFAIAGYNAGPGAVDRWREQFGHLHRDEFVEQIPYDETRGYTRKVLRSYAAYRALYGPEGDADPWLEPRDRRPGALERAALSARPGDGSGPTVDTPDDALLAAEQD